MDTQLSAELRSILEDQIEALTETLAAGHIQTYDDYRYKTGQIRGLKIALAELDEALGRMYGARDA